MVDRNPVEPPPLVVAVVGPPKVGKTTLINNLIKLFTRHPLTEVKGPVTLVIGKKRRVTFIECNNDVNSMIDLAKVADLVLLLCDASFGFEMEIFEFLNICQVHGMPRIMGILTHLDMIKNNKTLKNVKKTLKHRFWTEVYPGAKLFYLSGILHGEYLRNEIKNLGRFISVMKFRPLQWRSTHSYLLGDRFEDLTNQEFIRKNPKCDRTISLYGYVRGVPLKKETTVHVAGLGDLKIHDISYLHDPCPLPEQLKKRALIEKEKLIYAPFSGVGGIVYDKDAVYVELGGSHSHGKKEDDHSNEIVNNIIEAKETLDEKMKHSELQLFTGGKKLTADDLDRSDDESEHYAVNLFQRKENMPSQDINDIQLERELNNLRKYETVISPDGITRRRVLFDTKDECNESESDEDEIINFAPANTYTTLKNNKDIAVHSKITEVLNVLYNAKSKENEFDGNREKVSCKSEEFCKELQENTNFEERGSDNSTEEESENSAQKQREVSAQEESENSAQWESENSAQGESENSDGEESEHSVEKSENSDEEMEVNWKTNIAEKAQLSFLERQASNKNPMRLVYSMFQIY